MIIQLCNFVGAVSGTDASLDADDVEQSIQPPREPPQESAASTDAGLDADDVEQSIQPLCEPPQESAASTDAVRRVKSVEDSLSTKSFYGNRRRNDPKSSVACRPKIEQNVDLELKSCDSRSDLRLSRVRKRPHRYC